MMYNMNSLVMNSLVMIRDQCNEPLPLLLPLLLPTLPLLLELLLDCTTLNAENLLLPTQSGFSRFNSLK